MNFAVPVDHRVKLKENKKKDKYLDLARGLKQTVEHESDGDTFGTVTKGLIQGLEVLEIRGVETIQTTALLRYAKILRRVLKTCEELLSLKLQ